MVKTKKSEVQKSKKANGRSKKEDTPMLPKLVAKDGTASPSVVHEDQPFPRSIKGKKDSKKIVAGSLSPTDSVDNQDASVKSGVVTHVTVNDLTPGTLVVGVITTVMDDEMEIDLPFHLTGSVSRDHASEPGIKMGRSEQWATLRKRFRRGQLVTAAVVENEGLRIQLTLRPSIINAGLTINNLSQRMWLPCTVKSFEDFGCSVDLGLGGDHQNVNVYVTRPKLDQAPQLRQWSFLRPGSIFEVAVTDVNVASRTVTCSMNAEDSLLPISTAVDRSLIRAGFLVEAKFNQIISGSKSSKSAIPPRALTATFCRVLSTTVTGLHSTRITEEASANQGDVTQISVGDKLPARIILQIPSRDLIFASCLEHLTSWMGPFSTPQGYTVLRCRPGVRLQSCRVAAVDPQFAARLSTTFNGNPIMADVAKSRCLDTNPEKISLQVGELVPEARVLSSNLCEMAVSVTTAPKMLDEPLLVVGDLKPGQLVTGEISHVSESTIFVKLSDYITARCPRDQATDVPVAELPPKFEVGKKLKFRVLYVDARSSSPYLTAKKTLVEDEHPLVDFTTDAVVGKLVYGVVQRILSGNPITLVRFYGGITGGIPTEEFERFNKQNKLKKGAVVQCQIVEADHLARSIKLTLDLSSKAVTGQSPLAVCSEIMQSLAVLRREKSSAVTPTEVVEWLKKSISKSTVQRLAPLKNWDDQKVYVFLPREVRTFTAPGAIVEQFQIVDVTDEFACVLFIVKNIKSDFIDEDNNDEDDDTPSAHKGLALTVGVIPLAHLSDNLQDTEALKKSLKEALKKEGSVDLSKINPTLQQRAVMLSAYCPLDSNQITSRVCLPILSLKPSMIKSAESGQFIKTMSDLNGTESSIRPGYVIRAIPSGVLVSMGSLHLKGYVPAKFCSTQILHNIPEAFPSGMNVNCKIISVENGVAVDPTSTLSPCIVDLRTDGRTSLSSSTNLKTTDPCITIALEMLESKSSNPPPQSPADLEIGKDYPAVVRKSGKGGVFVMLSRSVQARIALNQLTAEFIQPEQVPLKFPVGRVLSAVRVLSIGGKTMKDGTAAINVSYVKAGHLTLKPEEITKDTILGAVVKAKTSSGLILAIEDSELEATCYFKNITDDEKPNKEQVLASLEIGDRVAAKVLDTPESGRRLNVSLKPSAFGDEDEEIVTLQDQLAEGKKQERQRFVKADEKMNGESDHGNLSDDEAETEDGDDEKEVEKDESDEEETLMVVEKDVKKNSKKRAAEEPTKPNKKAKVEKVKVEKVENADASSKQHKKKKGLNLGMK